MYWSSDVCSSDLTWIQRGFRQGNSRGRCFERFEKSRIKGSLLQYVEQPGHRPALADLGLDRGETPGFGQGFEWGERYTVLAAPQQPNLVVPGNIGIEEQQFLSKLFPDGA